MKRLRFEELLLLSRKERRGRRIQLHPTSTVIKGANDTGKSALIKSLYWTLGAEPKLHPKWKAAGVYASLRFTIDDVAYRMIRVGRRFALYDAEDELIGLYTSVTSGLAPKIAELCDFRLILRNQRGTDEQATPAFLYLPFYLDQDNGWENKLASLQNLGQFRNFRKDAIYFHFGIRPSAYYLAKSRKTAAESKAAPLRQERTVLQTVLERIQAQLKIASFNVDIDAFREEVEVLLRKGTDLQKQEAKQKDKMARAYAEASAIEDQIAIAQRTIQDLRADQDFAAGLGGDSVECPVCHAEYTNGFSERFAIALDEDQCQELLLELDEELDGAREKYKKAATATRKTMELANELRALLRTKRKKLRLADLVLSESRRETRNVVEGQISEIEAKIGKLDTDRENAAAEMKSFTNKKHKDEILDDWRATLTDLVEALDLPTLPDDFYDDPAAPSNETGSDQSRALLAFYLSAVHTISAHSTSTICPLVIDSPNQQDQDDASYERIRTAIRDRRPKHSQLVLALADDKGTDFGGTVIELDKKLSLLRKSEYEDVKNELIPLYENALEQGQED